jgi:hypothetical protein
VRAESGEPKLDRTSITGRTTRSSERLMELELAAITVESGNKGGAAQTLGSL